MGAHPQGKVLAVALRPRSHRWWRVASGLIVSAIAFTFPTIYWLNRLKSPLMDKSLLVAIEYNWVGIIGLIAVCNVVWHLVLYSLAGATTVEISREPALIGQPLDYVVLQAPGRSALRSLKATLVYGRNGWTRRGGDVKTPLAPATGERDFRIQGTVKLPEGDETSGPGDAATVECFIRVTASYGRWLDLAEDYPFMVVRGPGKQVPSA